MNRVACQRAGGPFPDQETVFSRRGPGASIRPMGSFARKVSASAQALALVLVLVLVQAPALFAQDREHTPGTASFRIPQGTERARILAWINTIATKYGLDRFLIQAVMEAESGWDVTAVSPKGAQGLMQIMPGTARDLGLQDPLDPLASIEAGSRYLKAQLATFGDVRLALAAYNAGPEAVRKARGVPLIPETQNYVATVANRFIKLKTGKTLNQFVQKVLDDNALPGDKHP